MESEIHKFICVQKRQFGSKQRQVRLNMDLRLSKCIGLEYKNDEIKREIKKHMRIILKLNWRKQKTSLWTQDGWKVNTPNNKHRIITGEQNKQKYDFSLMKAN